MGGGARPYCYLAVKRDGSHVAHYGISEHMRYMRQARNIAYVVRVKFKNRPLSKPTGLWKL